MASDEQEMLMSTHQRGLVDTCFEEGQFESAIALLEQLRSPRYKPAPSHLRQLIYIALQPEIPPSVHDIVITDVLASPSKATLKKRIPSSAAVVAARRLLNSFAITNSPEAISAALPFYGVRKMTESAADDGSIESVIGPQSLCISTAQSCWTILTQGFVQHGQAFSMSLGKVKKRSHNTDEDDESMNDIENKIVGDDAWSTLEWLLLLFERDEIFSDSRGLGLFSNLLLRQIPPPRTGMGSRWDIQIPLRVIFFCMEQSEITRQTLGSRLMTQLVNLSASPHLDLPMFVASLYSHLTATGLEKLPALLSTLSSSRPVHMFKVLLCQKLLTDSKNDGGRGGQPRARARALKVTRTEEDINSQPTVKIASPQGTKRSNIPSCSEIVRCLERGRSPTLLPVTLTVLMRVKFELVNSYGMLQSEAAPTERDSEWAPMLHDGKLKELIDTVFGPESEFPGGCIYRDVLHNIMSTWRGGT